MKVLIVSDESLFFRLQPLITRTIRRVSVLTALCFCISISGCATHYYEVNDPVTGKTYYTDDLKEIKGDGVKLKDAQTGEIVILQSSEVREINKYEYDTGRMSMTPQ